MNVLSALQASSEHRAAHAQTGDSCWRCEPRASTTLDNHFLALIEDPAHRCLWCDGTGWHLYASYVERRRGNDAGNEWWPCAACHATGRRA